MKDTWGILQEVFSGLDETAGRELAAVAAVRRYPPDVTLCQEGAYEDVFYIIAEGRVAILKRFAEGDERLLRYSEAGNFFGEMALIQNTPRNATVRTVTACTMIEINKASFEEALRRNPVMALRIIHTSVERLRENDAQAIAELSAQEARIKAAYNELAEQESSRFEFLTTLAHELRTPLTSALGFAELIEQGQMGGPILAMGLGKVTDGIDRVVSLVNDLLFAQEMDLIQPSLRLIDVGDIVEDEIRLVSGTAQAQNILIRVARPFPLPYLNADPDSLGRSLRAMIDNAIKFSPNGGEIEVRITVSDYEMHIAVQDPGVGIPEEFFPRLFKQFERQEKHGDYLFGGVGLGLPIAKHLIESMGGRIEVQSIVGKGSTFTIHMPLQPSQHLGT